MVTTPQILLLFEAVSIVWAIDQSSRPLDQLLGCGPDRLNVISYRLWTPEEIKQELDLWATKYPDLVQISSAQETFGLPLAGNQTECANENQTGCQTYFFTIQDFIAHPVSSESSTQLPEVFWNGAFLGSERLGPTIVMEAASLLLEAASCEAKPRRNGLPWNQELNDAWSCRLQLKEKGIDDERRRWLARLVSTRRIVSLPSANAFYDGTIDPSRDFPFDLSDPSLCMRSIAARTVNEIFRRHMFQIGISFHGGRNLVSYSWGSPTLTGYVTPDNTAMSYIAQAFSDVAGIASYHYSRRAETLAA